MKRIQDDRILSYIETRLEKGDGIPEIAGHFGYSPEHFRHLFRTYYDVSLGTYLRRRRLIHAAKQLSGGQSVTEIALSHGFDTEAGFSKAFRKEFGFSANELKAQGELFADWIPDPVYDKNQITITHVRTPEICMVGRPLPPEELHEFDRLEECAYWLDHDVCRVTEEECAQLGAYKDDIIAMWYHGEDMVMNYLAGPVVKNRKPAPEGMIPVMLPPQDYAVFGMKHKASCRPLAEDVRRLGKYIFWEWLPANRLAVDKMGWTFERYRAGRAFLYLPLL